jgi:hypothetical protein
LIDEDFAWPAIKPQHLQDRACRADALRQMSMNTATNRGKIKGLVGCVV